MLYALARPLLFALDPETAHLLTLGLADAAQAARLLATLAPRVPPSPVRAMGLEFPNPVGLAAGLDKNAEHIDALAALGFGFIEVGTVTPRPQPGNPRPRLFRLPRAQALINRFGFNNVGLEAFMANVARARWRGVLGINIGKNFDTPVERAAEDYLACLEGVYRAASYVAVNVSSPLPRQLCARRARRGRPPPAVVLDLAPRPGRPRLGAAPRSPAPRVPARRPPGVDDRAPQGAAVPGRHVDLIGELAGKADAEDARRNSGDERLAVRHERERRGGQIHVGSERPQDLAAPRPDDGDRGPLLGDGGAVDPQARPFRLQPLLEPVEHARRQLVPLGR